MQRATLPSAPDFPFRAGGVRGFLQGAQMRHAWSYIHSLLYRDDTNTVSVGTSIQHHRLVTGPCRGSTALQRSTAVYSLQLYSGLQSTCSTTPLCFWLLDT